MFHFIYILMIIPLYNQQGAPYFLGWFRRAVFFNSENVNDLISEKYLKLTQLCSVFVFSHDKQETEEVVQLQEGRSICSCNSHD